MLDFSMYSISLAHVLDLVSVCVRADRDRDRDQDQDQDIDALLHDLAQRHPRIAHHITDFPRYSRNRGICDLFFEDVPSQYRGPPPYRTPRYTEESSLRRDKATQTGGLLQYGLRNTIDLGQKTSVSENGHRRAMSAPPEVNSCPDQTERVNNCNSQTGNATPNVRHIPIFVEGRDQPVVNVDRDPGPEPRSTPPRDEAFFRNHDMTSGFRQPSHFAKAFGDPFPGFNRRRNVSPFQNAGDQRYGQQQARPPPTEPERASPKFFQRKNFQPEPDEIPPQKRPQQHKFGQPNSEQIPVQRQEPSQPPPPRDEPDIPEQPKIVNDPITKIQAIQRDVLELMTKVESFKGSKKDKEYIYLDEMLTRNLIKLDDIETEGKENIRLARREAIKCIQKCIAVMEAKAEIWASSNAESVCSNPESIPDPVTIPADTTDFREEDNNVVVSNRQSAYDNVDDNDKSAFNTQSQMPTNSSQ